MSNAEEAPNSTTSSESTETETTTTTTTETPAEEPKTDAAASSSLLDDDNKAEAADDTSDQSPAFDITEVTSEDIQGALPEGFEFNEETANRFSEILNGATSRKDLATQLVTFQADLLRQDAEATVKEFNAKTAAWQAEVKKARGDTFEQDRGAVRQLIQTYSDNPTEILEILRVSGLGSHPGLFNMLHKLSTELSSEAPPVNGSVAPGKPSRAERLFTST